MNKNVNIYRSLKEISAVLFYEIKFSNNIKMLDRNYREENRYTDNQISYITSGWVELYDQYFEKSNNPCLKRELKNKNETTELLLSINLIEKTLSILIFLKNNTDYISKETYLNTVSSLGDGLKKINKRIVFDISKPIENQIDKAKDVLGGLQTRYKILFKEDKEFKAQDLSLFYEIKASIEDVFKRNLDENVNMLQWIAYENNYRKSLESTKQNGKHNISTRKSKRGN